ncbi:glyoxal oxidase N-terminus-domain-containing protein [Mycena albidolilacea]|uniref:Glyoxal oxidase N-terminus-domain-containing protein n=1 Tax=Mycena albidolilacea TaxID=1033008 RepID=A0AAD6Z4P1_9AGAR|nr:glyoxal oxidase N-terminus-domain-containing protein [Mycena albidolilacea]
MRTMGTTFQRLFTLLGLLHYGASATSLAGNWTLVQQGMTGVSGLQLAVVSETKTIIIDKVENNALMVDGHIAWAVELDINTQEVRALDPLSNTWCATGSFLSNGTLLSSGGSPIRITGEDGLQALRLFTPCTDGSCDILEDPMRIRLTSARWYPSSVRIEDGSVLIFGGSLLNNYINNATINNPTYEFYPPKNIHGFNGLQIPSQFLNDTINGNHFPNLVYLPDGRVFISANTQVMIFDWKKNTETRLPGIPNGVRISSPFSAGHVLLPLSAENNFTPEILICGGSTVSDFADPLTLTSQEPTSSQCIRMALDEAGIAKGWEVDQLPEGRIMADLILLPDGRVLVIDGAMTGVAGYGNVADQIGQSNADNPAFMPVIYDPAAPLGSRFSRDGLIASTIPRIYHSTASLTPNGTIMLAGSNPNADVSTIKYATEYRLEFLSPPYMTVERPSYTGLPATFDFKSKITLDVDLPEGAKDVKVALMDLGFATHAVHMDQRLLYLDAVLHEDKTKLTVTGPPTPALFPPGPGFLFVVTDSGVPSFGHQTLIGTGASPPVDEDAIANMLNKTTTQPDVP